MAGQMGFRPGRVQELYDAGVNAIPPTPEQIAYMDRLQQMLDSIPDANAAAARAVAAGGMPAGARRAVGPDGRSVVILDALAPTADDQLDAAAAEISPDPMVEDLPIYGRKVVGPRTPMGGDPVPGAPMHSQEEVDDYYRRSIDPKTGSIVPSGADQGMLERGFRVVMGPDGRPTYMMASDTTGMSQGLTGSAPIQAAEQRRLVETGYWDPAGTRPGLDGGTVDVLVPTQANREYNAARTEQRQQNDHLRRMVAAQRELNPNAKPDQIQALVGDVPATQQERYAAQMRARAMQQGMREARMREEREFAGGSQNINMGNAGAIRALVQMRREDPETYRKMQAEHMRPRNVQYRFNPRTGQVEMTSQVSYEPPAQGEDGRAVMAMMQRTMQQEMLAREREEKKIPIRATANGMARGGLWGRPHTREEARNKLIDAEVGDVTLIDEVLNEIYGPAANVPPAPPTARPPGVAPVGPDMDSDSAPLPATTW